MFDHPNSLSVVHFQDFEPTGIALTLKIAIPQDKFKLSMEALKVQGLDLYSDEAEIARVIRGLFPVGALSQKDAYSELCKWATENGLNNLPCVAHSARFDWGFLNHLDRNTSVQHCSPLGPTWICTKHLASVAFGPKVKSVSLDSCCNLLEIENTREGGHDSAVDALLCGKVYAKLVAFLIEHGQGVQG